MKSNTISAIVNAPDPETVTLVAALLRHLLTLAAGAGITVGVYSDSTLSIIAAAIVGIVGVVWSLWQKYEAARNGREPSLALSDIS